MVRVHGRADNVIVSGGINISLDRVERIVRSVPGLHQAVVVGVDDERWGGLGHRRSARGGPAAQRVRAARPGQEAVAREIGAHARPSRLILVDELDVLSSGKPDREAIRRMVASF